MTRVARMARMTIPHSGRQMKGGYMSSNASAIVLLPAGGSNFRIDYGEAVGSLAGELPERGQWERQALVDQAQSQGWTFVHQQQVIPPGNGIRMSFER
jgi:hypothetical protein